MLSPAFGKFKFFTHAADLAAHIFHGIKISIYSLSKIKPCFLGCVASEHCTFAGKNHPNISEQIRCNFLSQPILQPMRECVIQCHWLVVRSNPRVRSDVFHPSNKSSRHHQSCRILVIFHVILRRMGQDYIRLNFSNDRCHFLHGCFVVEDFEILKKRGMAGTGGEGRRGLRLLPTTVNCFLSREILGTTAPVGEVPEMDITTRIFQT